MSTTIAVNAKLERDVTHVRVLVRHPMTAGSRPQEKKGTQPVDPFYVKEIECLHAGKSVLKAQIGPHVATDPYMQFSFKGGKTGDTLVVSWINNKGQSDTLTTTIR